MYLAMQSKPSKTGTRLLPGYGVGAVSTGCTNFSMFFTGYGKLHYEETELRLVLQLEQDLSDYYRALIPPYLRVYKQGWPAHITVVRPGFESPPKIRYWGNYEGERVEFIYTSYLECGMGYYWFNAWSKRLEAVREELGLVNMSRFALKPEGYTKTFHCTVGKYVEYFDFGEAPEK